MNKNAAKRFLSYGACYAFAILLVDVLIDFLFSYRRAELDIGWISYLLWALAGALNSEVKGRLARLLLPVSVAVFLVGNLNSVASYFHYGNYYLVDLKSANTIYSLYALVFSVSIRFFDSRGLSAVSADYNSLRKERVDTIFFIFVVVFPALWIADELYALRRIPLLSGQSIVDDIYTTEYGRLYGYGVLLAVCALVYMAKLRDASRTLKFIYGALLLFVAFAMVFDGRRVFLLIFLGAALSYHMVSSTSYSLLRPVLKIVPVVLLVYVAILYQRQGGELITHFDAAQVFSKVGVEYRDFAYLVTHLKPGDLDGYSWLLSSLGGFGNKYVLFFSGLNKSELVFSGSAYQIGIALNKGAGIRIGLFPEIWLQFGFLGLAFVPLVTGLFIWISRRVELSKSEVGRAIAATAFGVAILSFVGQSSAITGYWSLLIYLYLAWRFLELFRNPYENKYTSRSGAPRYGATQ